MGRTVVAQTPGRRARASRVAVLAALAALVGVGAGVGAVAFRWLVDLVTRAFTGHPDSALMGHGPHGVLPAAGPWVLLAAPVVAGLLYGPLVHLLAPEARGAGVSVVVAAAGSDGRVRPRVALVKLVASALCLGGGGSLGREGPIIQIGAALGSGAGQLARLDRDRLRLLLACGAAGGIAGTFLTPAAGVLFAAEVVLRDLRLRTLAVLAVASVGATVVVQALVDVPPTVVVPRLAAPPIGGYAAVAGLGLVAGLVGAAYVRVVQGLQDAGDRVWRGPEWARPAVGGVLLGLLLLAVPELYGVGTPVVIRAVAGGYAVTFLLVLVVAKAVATGLTLAIGGVGGVIGPSLFVGSTLGAAYGEVLHRLLPDVVGSAAPYALTGMAAVLAVAGRAPVTAAATVLELSRTLPLAAPLLVGVLVAAAVGHVVTRRSIFFRGSPPLRSWRLPGRPGATRERLAGHPPRQG
jgi:CIC family chloride channel protein